ncbi:esterase/lipase family protein [Undibacterium curvum]|uniref:esterase/lipase family protein n=1 Tax=Undibacterium curvum TaxID=2762294 RepID=UPI003D11A51D
MSEQNTPPRKPDAGPVYHYGEQNANGTQEVYVTLTENSDTREKNIVFASQWVIPVIFVPGVMGTNLKKKGDKTDDVWHPPNGTWDTAALAFGFFFKNAKKRQILFNKDEAEVDWGGPIEADRVQLHNDKDHAKKVLYERGWGSVHWSSYGEILQDLHLKLNQEILVRSGPLSTPELQEWWAKTMQADPADFGCVTGQAKPLTEKEIKELKRYRFEIWCCGYNWLQSNSESARDLDAYIQKVLKVYEREDEPRARKVIVVTHSMGGLVTRGMLQLPGAQERVLGVVHGVQPATGAPAVYKRARCGFEGAEQVVLGRNAAEATAVMANAPALLEMLPFADYNRGKPWLKVEGHAFALPKEGDPFGEIYGSTAWYGLVPEQSTNLIDPAKMIVSTLKDGKTVRDVFDDTLRFVLKFQKSITQPGSNYHPVTHAYCGIDRERKTWGEFTWRGQVPAEMDISNAQLMRDDGDGRIMVGAGKQIALKEDAPNQDSDSIVSAWSGVAPFAYSKSFFIHGQGQVPDENSINLMRTSNADAPAWKKSYEHQFSYGDDKKLYRGLWATLYGITRIAQLADWAK